jgi:parallel beta helix pectate lyase-like protein
MRTGVWAWMAGTLLTAMCALSGCNSDTPTTPHHDPVVFRIPIEISFEDAAAQALPGDTLSFELSPLPLAQTVVLNGSQTPLVLTGTRYYPVLVAPAGFPALRITSPKAGTRLQHLAFSGGNTTLDISGSGSVRIDDCRFTGGQIQLAASGENLTVDVSNSLFQRPSVYGIEIQSQTVLHASTLSIVFAGDCGILMSQSARARVLSSIIYQAVHYGIACTGTGGLTADSGCNDIFGSTHVLDCTEPATDFSVDPLFCDESHNQFTIMSISPCAPENSGGCGQVGAFLPACDPPPPP